MTSLWNEAQKDLSDQDRQILVRPENNRREILNDILKMCEQQSSRCLQRRWKIPGLNGKELILRDLCGKLARSVNNFLSVVDVAVQYDPMHAALPWAGVRFFIQLSINDVATFDAMIEGLETISRIIARYSIVEILYGAAESQAKAEFRDQLVRVYAAVLNYLCLARKYYNHGTATRIIVSTFRPLDLDRSIHTITERENTLCKVMDLIDAQRQLDVLYLSQTSDMTTKEVRGDIKDMQIQHKKLQAILQSLDGPIVRCMNHLSALQSKVQEDLRVSIMSWMSTVPYRKHHELMFADFMPGLGRWLLLHPLFVEWEVSSTSQILWLHGDSGCGKTKLMAFVVEELRKKAANTPNASPITCFYCARNQAELVRADPLEILRAIAKQICCETGSGHTILSAVQDDYKKARAEAEKDGQKPASLNLHDCLDLIKRMLDLTPATIIIDALDECNAPERHNLFAALHQIIEEARNVVKIIVSSREDSDIAVAFGHHDNIKISEANNQMDIGTYIPAKLAEAIGRKRILLGEVSPKLRQHIITELELNAHGMFRWVSLQIESLCNFEKFKCEEDVIEAIKTLPETLFASYRATYCRIIAMASRSKSIAVATLKWILGARRILSINELIKAVQMTVSEAEGTIKASTILDCCCGLVSHDHTLETFRLAHPSVQEFLQSLPEFRMSEVDAVLGKGCLAMQMSPNDSSNNGITPYESLFWAVHVDNAARPYTGSPELADFLFKEEHLEDWLDSLDHISLSLLAMDSSLLQRLNAVKSSPASPIFTIACFGLTGVLGDSAYLHTSFDWNQRNQSGVTALYLAARCGKTDTVRYLVDHGADVNAVGGDLGSPLQAAAFVGSNDIINILISAGARSTSSGSFGNAISAAANGGQEETACLLIKAGIEFSDQKAIQDCLRAAAFSGQSDLVQLINERFASQLQDTDRQDSLQTALYARKERQARSLLRQYLDINAQTGHFGNALQAAICGGKQSLVELILAHGAGITAKGRYGSPLRAACVFGHSELVLWLLDEKAADPNIEDPELGDCLQAAASKGDCRIMSILLTRNAKIDGTGGLYGSALHAAAHLGHEAAVRFLLDKKADISISTCRHTSALQAAISGGQVSIFRLLWDLGESWNPYTPFQKYSFIMLGKPDPGSLCHRQLWTGAVARMTEEPSWRAAVLRISCLLLMIWMLRVSCTMVCYQIDDEEPLGTIGPKMAAIRLAACRGNIDIVHHLSDRERYANAVSLEMGTPLHAALAGSHLDIAELLLEKGAEIDKCWSRWGSCLQVFTERGDFQVVEWLLAHGASTGNRRG